MAEGFSQGNAALGPLSDKLYIASLDKFVDVQRAFVDATALGDTPIVPAQGAGKKIRVLAYSAVSTVANSIHFRSATNPISSTKPLGANGGIVGVETRHGWFETNANEALNVNMSVATATGVDVVYVVI